MPPFDLISWLQLLFSKHFFDNVGFVVLSGLAGYMIHKSIPYGTIDEALPYLSRRVNENSSIFGGIRRERKIIRTALVDRLQLRA